MPRRFRPRTPSPRAAAPHPAVGTELELEVTGVAHGGVMVARHEGRVVFVSDAIPGERVRARVTEAHKDRFWRADTVTVLDAAPERQTHVWAEASVDRDPEDRAGGAEFGHIALPYQRELKARVLADALERMAGVSAEIVVEALDGDDESRGTGWRTRATLHVAPDGTAGPYAARSHRVVPVASLPLVEGRLETVAPLDVRLPDAASVDLVAPSGGPAEVLVTPRGDGRKAGSPSRAITERVGEREFRLDVRGFWQVHRLAAGTLTAAVQDAVDGALFDPRAANLDLYGGVGLLAAAIGDRFGSTTRITSVEANETATEYAGLNLADWVGASVRTARVESFVAGLAAEATAVERDRQRAATVVLDPPRSGAGRVVIDELLAYAPAQLVYVACDPVAFARDTALLREGGYELRTLRAFDLFPNTHHVEVVASFAAAA